MRTVRLYLWGAVVVMVAGSVLLCVWQQSGSSSSDGSPNGAPPTFRPAFSLTDHQGNAVTEQNYSDKWLLVFFGFTNCPDVCPTTLAELALVMDQLGEDAGAVKPLFVSIDPERDTVGPMADFVSAFHPSIVGLTGTASQVTNAVESFKAYYEKQPQDSAPNGYTMAHSTALYLISPEGISVRAYGYGTSSEKIVEDLRTRL